MDNCIHLSIKQLVPRPFNNQSFHFLSLNQWIKSRPQYVGEIWIRGFHFSEARELRENALQNQRNLTVALRCTAGQKTFDSFSEWNLRLQISSAKRGRGIKRWCTCVKQSFLVFRSSFLPRFWRTSYPGYSCLVFFRCNSQLHANVVRGELWIKGKHFAVIIFVL